MQQQMLWALLSLLLALPFQKVTAHPEPGGDAPHGGRHSSVVEDVVHIAADLVHGYTVHQPPPKPAPIVEVQPQPKPPVKVVHEYRIENRYDPSKPIYIVDELPEEWSVVNVYADNHFCRSKRA